VRGITACCAQISRASWRVAVAYLISMRQRGIPSRRCSRVSCRLCCRMFFMLSRRNANIANVTRVLPIKRRGISRAAQGESRLFARSHRLSGVAVSCASTRHSYRHSASHLPAAARVPSHADIAAGPVRLHRAATLQQRHVCRGVYRIFSVALADARSTSKHRRYHLRFGAHLWLRAAAPLLLSINATCWRSSAGAININASEKCCTVRNIA